MKVVKYLKEHGTEKLNEEFGIIVKPFGNLLVLNYDQIKSPKSHPIVIECRSLILEQGTFEVVSRSFDRFFNLGEVPESQKHLDISKAVCFEKVDGSLIKIYNYQSNWYIATRGTAFADAQTAVGTTFYELVLKALACKDDVEFQILCDDFLNPEWTYIFEITSVENRVVKRYEGYTLHYLASRHNATGEYGDDYESHLAYCMGAELPKTFSFESVEHCIEAAKSLTDLEEGYVVYQDGIPVCKVKSPAYVAVHHIKGEGLTPKRIMQLVLMGEQDEYLKYFPEDEKFFKPYLEAYYKLAADIDETDFDTFDIEDQKEFALAVVSRPYSAVMFQSRLKNRDPWGVFLDQNETYKLKVLGSYVNA